MAASEAAIYGRMRSAGVPPHAYDRSLIGLKQPRFAGIISGREYNLLEAGLVSYLVRSSGKPSSPNVPLVCAVAAKELVLQRVSVQYLSYAELAGKVTTNWWEGDWTGYVVISELGEQTTNWPKNVWDTVQSMLLSHISRGGAVIVGDTGALELGLFSEEFLNAIEVFEQITVE